jgi:hypothetical protein
LVSRAKLFTSFFSFRNRFGRRKDEGKEVGYMCCILYIPGIGALVGGFSSKRSVFLQAYKIPMDDLTSFKVYRRGFKNQWRRDFVNFK